MANLRIPQGAQQSLILLTNLSEHSMRSLKEGFKKSSPTLSVDDLAKAISPEVGLEIEQVKNLIRVLGSLFSVRVENNFSYEQFTNELSDAIKETDNQQLKLPPERLNRLLEDIKELLSNEDVLGVSGRALGVMHEHEHVWRSSRVLTDLRPVFASDPSRPPSAFVLIHNLRITYVEGGRSSEFFVALDSSDLRKLQETLERAVKKETSLKAFAEKTGIPCLYSDSE
jgi:hypothetical protein